MISGGEHKEWLGEHRKHIKELMMEENVQYEEWLWDQTLQDGPPQNDDISWLKLQAFKFGKDIMFIAVRDNMSPGEEYEEAMKRLGAL